MLRDEITRTTFQSGEEIRLSEDWTAVTCTTKKDRCVRGEFPEIYSIMKKKLCIWCYSHILNLFKIVKKFGFSVVNGEPAKTKASAYYTWRERERACRPLLTWTLKWRLLLTSVNPLFRSIKPPPEGLFISSPFEEVGDLIETGGLIFNLEKTMVSVLHKELEYKVQKLKNKKVGSHAVEDQNQIRASSW